MRIAITGATGFLGHQPLRRPQGGHRAVRPQLRLRPGLPDLCPAPDRHLRRCPAGRQQQVVRLGRGRCARPSGRVPPGWEGGPRRRCRQGRRNPAFGRGCCRGSLQASGVYVMPYINGRLWDTHDRGREDLDFSRRALPAATKDEQGKPYIEMYGSRESDNSPVQLAPMCPTTELWRSTMRETVLRLCGPKATGPLWIRSAKPSLPTACSPPNATRSPTRRSSTAT